MLWHKLQGAGGLVGGGSGWFSRTNNLSDRIYSITTDPADSAVVAGDYGNGNRALVAKASASGVFQWYKWLYVGPGSGFRSVATNASNDIFVAGSTIVPPFNYNNGLLAKYDQSGALQWVRSLSPSSSSSTVLFGVAVDNSGDVVVCGYTASGAYILLAKYDTTGTLLWQAVMTINNAVTFITSVAIDSADNIVLCGYNRLSSQFRTVVAKFATDGTVLWGVSFPVVSYGFSCCVDSSDDIYIASRDDSYYGVRAGVLAKLSSSGVLQWIRAQYVPSVGVNGFSGVVSDTTGNVYVTGSGGYSHPGGAGSANSICKYSSSGALLWDHVVSTNAAAVFPSRVTVDSLGTPILVVPDRISTYDGLCVCKVPADGSGLGIYTSPSGNFETIYYDNPMAPYVPTYATPSITATPITLSSVAFTITSTAPTFTDTSYTSTYEEVVVI